MPQPLDPRRRYPRVMAPVVFRSDGLALFHHNRSPVDISLGGMRVLSDEILKPGRRLELELLLPDRSTILCWGVVAWVIALPPDSPALYEVGVEFTDLDPADTQQLASLLYRDPSA